MKAKGLGLLGGAGNLTDRWKESCGTAGPLGWFRDIVSIIQRPPGPLLESLPKPKHF